ncbi:MAG: hypothetical protein IT429_10305 [Gemmataceae bacterium]|nr:hypothetical protein [Gemmataceae bacterium]
MKRTSLLACALLCTCLALAAQPAAPALDPKLLDAFTARSIGPANMGGRIVDVAIVESNPAMMYIASASGGLWKTTDAGRTWAPVFDQQPTLNLGAVAVAPSNPNVVWVGTGEANPRNSVAWGDGVYRSTDGGQTWQNMGLKDTHHVGRIVIHPKDPNVVYVAALGHLWGSNKERGLYRTTDGGKAWELSKYIDDETGFIDVAMDPTEPATLYAAAYRVRRNGFSGGNPAVQTGAGAGLYRTTDGGKNWERMTQGLPARPYGRCGLAIYRKDPRIIYAVVQTDLTTVTVQGQGPNLKQRTVGDAQGKKKVPLTPDHGGIFRSTDRGQTWTWVNSLCPRPFYYGQIRIDPNDAERIYVLGIQFHVSSDGGKTFPTKKKSMGAHPDHHALWINPKDSNHLVLGNDGGLYFSRNRGASWEHVRGMPLGQFYAVAVDMRRPYRVYGGLQDNGSWGGPSATRRTEGITLADWYRILGSDGFQCQVDPTNPDVVYAEAQYGRPQRIQLNKKGKSIQPAAPRGAVAYRFNWNTPLLLSVHNPRVLYVAGNHVFRSENRGDAWERISPDLTRGRPGPSKHTGHTISAFAESPRRADVLYAGSDDGRLHVTRDSGASWTELTANVPGVPAERWVSRLECSHHDDGTAYLALDRHRNDDRRPYLFRTTDFGKTWVPLTNGLPAEGSVYVVRESSRNRDLLFAGTEFGLFVSLDRGAHWHRLRGGMPNVAVHDLVIHPRDRELVIGTHGRSVYVMDVAPLEELTPQVAAAGAHLFPVRPALVFRPHKSSFAPGKSYVAPNPSFGATLWVHLKAVPAQPPTLTILDRTGRAVASVKVAPRPGLQQVMWDLRLDVDREALVPAGEYTARLQAGNVSLTRPVRVEAAE